MERVIPAGREILLACIEAGGALTGEHGVGLEKQAFMPLVFGEDDLDVMARVRAAIDPEGRMNPDKMLPSSAACHDASVAALRQKRGMQQPPPAREGAEGLWV
jgi:glycolate oxidase